MNTRLEVVRTYDLSTVSGAWNAATQTLAPVALAVLAWYFLPGDTAAVVAVVMGGLMALFVAPAWFNWVMMMGNARLREAAIIQVITPQIAALQYETGLEAARRDTLRELAGLPEGAIEYARLVHGRRQIIVSGQRLSWLVGGMEIPVTFAADWWREYQKAESDNLPSQSSFAGYPSRDIMREWNKAVTNELLKTGTVVSATSQHPPRWIVKDERQREQALRDTGVYIAVQLCELILTGSEAAE